MFWILIFGLTTLTIALLLRPLLREQQSDGDTLAYDREVYKDQLSEIDRDFDNGLLTENEAELGNLNKATVDLTPTYPTINVDGLDSYNDKRNAEISCFNDNTCGGLIYVADKYNKYGCRFTDNSFG